jgi:hypothetical protein
MRRIGLSHLLPEILGDKVPHRVLGVDDAVAAVLRVERAVLRSNQPHGVALNTTAFRSNGTLVDAVLSFLPPPPPHSPCAAVLVKVEFEAPLLLSTDRDRDLNLIDRSLTFTSPSPSLLHLSTDFSKRKRCFEVSISFPSLRGLPCARLRLRQALQRRL